MSSLRIINHGSGDYSVTVTTKGVTSEPFDFDDHGDMTDFVTALKQDGYTVVNDAY
jgi:hypothetical protein